MKKKLENVVMPLLIATLLVGAVGIAGYIECHYDMQGTVTKVENNSTYIEDVSGHIWEVTNSNLEIGEKVEVKFHTCGTTQRKDDKIEKVNRLEK